MSSWGNYNKIMKLFEGNADDVALGYELMMARADNMHPTRWKCLYNAWRGRSTVRWYFDGTTDMQKWLYDKRKQEKESLRSNKKTSGKQK